MKSCQKKYFVFTLMVLVFFIFGCAPKVSKTAYINHFLGADYAQIIGDSKICMRWDSCIAISKAEFEMSVNEIYDTCIKQEGENLPDMLSYGDRKSFEKSTDLCATDTFFKKYKENFTFDKTPECIEGCKKVKNYIKKLR